METLRACKEDGDRRVHATNVVLSQQRHLAALKMVQTLDMAINTVNDAIKTKRIATAMVDLSACLAGCFKEFGSFGGVGASAETTQKSLEDMSERVELALASVMTNSPGSCRDVAEEVEALMQQTMEGMALPALPDPTGKPGGGYPGGDDASPGGGGGAGVGVATAAVPRSPPVDTLFGFAFPEVPTPHPTGPV